MLCHKNGFKPAKTSDTSSSSSSSVKVPVPNWWQPVNIRRGWWTSVNDSALKQYSLSQNICFWFTTKGKISQKLFYWILILKNLNLLFTVFTCIPASFLQLLLNAGYFLLNVWHSARSITFLRCVSKKHLERTDAAVQLFVQMFCGEGSLQQLPETKDMRRETRKSTESHHVWFLMSINRILCLNLYSTMNTWLNDFPFVTGEFIKDFNWSRLWFNTVLVGCQSVMSLCSRSNLSMMVCKWFLICTAVCVGVYLRITFFFVFIIKFYILTWILIFT